MPKANRKPTTSPDEAAPPELGSWAAKAAQTPKERLRQALHRVICAADVLRLMATANITGGDVIDGSAVQLIGVLIGDEANEIEEAFALLSRSAGGDLVSAGEAHP